MSLYECDVAIIVVTDIEEGALKHMYDWTPLYLSNDEQLYFESEFFRDGKKRRVVYGRQSEMGMTAAATLTTKLVLHFKPRYVFMVGVAAGIAPKDLEEQIYGDVIVADVIWNYSSGKYVSRERADIHFGELGFVPRPTMIKMKGDMRAYVEAAAKSDENQCHVHIGPIASGNSVVANNEILNKQIRSQLTHTAGLDMEAYAVVYAVENAILPKPTAFVIKSVCDYADSQKSDQYQKFAAFTSAEFGKLLYEKFLPLD